MCSDLWPVTACEGGLEVKMGNGTCYERGPEGNVTVFRGIYDTKLAAVFDIKPVIPSEEYFM